jgi:flavodoxin
MNRTATRPAVAGQAGISAIATNNPLASPNLPGQPTRRDLMTAMAGLSMAGGVASAAGDRLRMADLQGPILVAWFSRTGNTRVVAGLLHRSLTADLFEIAPTTPYPEDYLATVELARQQRDQGTEPALKARVPDMARYKTILLGMPIWGETAPPLIRSFLSAHDLAGKTLVPFITHGGYGLGNSEAVIARHAPKARLRRAFSMQADQERRTMDRVNAWLAE